MPPRSSALSVLEAAYELERSDADWLRGVAEQLAAVVLPRARDVFGVRFDVARSTPRPWEPPISVRGGLEPLSAVSTHLPVDTPERVARTFGGPNGWRSGADLTRGDPGWERGAARLRAEGHGDVVVVNCSDAAGRGFALFGTFAARPVLRARVPVSQLAAHVAAAHRLRSALADPRRAAPAAVLTPAGRVLDAQGPAATGTAREALRRYAQRIDRARSRRHRDADALDVWTALVDGRWSLVDRFERDGRRYLVAIENAAALEVPAPLSAKARAVLSLIVKGHSTKLVAYELGLSEAVVAWHVRQLVRFFRVPSRRALVTALRPFLPEASPP